MGGGTGTPLLVISQMLEGGAVAWLLVLAISRSFKISGVCFPMVAAFIFLSPEDPRDRQQNQNMKSKNITNKKNPALIAECKTGWKLKTLQLES